MPVVPIPINYTCIFANVVRWNNINIVMIARIFAFGGIIVSLMFTVTILSQNVVKAPCTKEPK